MIKTEKVNLHWEDINMAELELEKLILHFAQSNRAEGKSPKTVSWYLLINNITDLYRPNKLPLRVRFEPTI